MKKKAVIFDLWNTIIVRKDKTLTNIIADYYSLPQPTVYEWMRLSSLTKDKTDKYYFIKMICQANNILFREEDKAFLDSVYGTFYEGCSWIDNAKELLINLREKGYLLGVLSNTSEISDNVLVKFGLNSYVDCIVLSYQLGYLKPDPRIFQHILKEMNIEVNEAIMIGDKITTDVLGAKSINMDIIYFDKNQKESNLKPNVSFVAIVNKLSDISKIL